MFGILVSVMVFEMYGVSIAQHKPTWLGRKFGYKTRTTLSKCNERWGQWDINGNHMPLDVEFEMAVGTVYNLWSSHIVGLGFVLRPDGNVDHYISLPEFSVSNDKGGLIKFGPVVELVG